MNDCLQVSILIRFRENNVALVGDIEKAFLNVEVDSNDRDSLRFLWVDDLEGPVNEVVVYRFCRVVFGLNSSPFLLNATLRHHVLRYVDGDPEFTQKVLDSFYVDDLVSGESTVQGAFDLYKKAKDRMAEEGFNLRKWATNSKVLKSWIDRQEAQVSEGVDLNEHFMRILNLNENLMQNCR